MAMKMGCVSDAEQRLATLLLMAFYWGVYMFICLRREDIGGGSLNSKFFLLDVLSGVMLGTPPAPLFPLFINCYYYAAAITGSRFSFVDKMLLLLFSVGGGLLLALAVLVPPSAFSTSSLASLPRPLFCYADAAALPAASISLWLPRELGGLFLLNTDTTCFRSLFPPFLKGVSGVILPPWTTPSSELVGITYI